MAKTDDGDGGKFSELFDLIGDYAKRDQDYQEKALRLITVAYEGSPKVNGMPDARQTVDDILNRHDYVFPLSGIGTLDPYSVDAVERVALYAEENREWGIDRLGRMLRGLVLRLNAEGGYPDYAEDTGIVMAGLQTVVTGALVEEIVEDLVEDLTDDAAHVTPAVNMQAPERAEEAAPLIDRQELMDLLAKADTPIEVAVARGAADSYLASNPSDGDVRAARDHLPAPAGDQT